MKASSKARTRRASESMRSGGKARVLFNGFCTAVGEGDGKPFPYAPGQDLAIGFSFWWISNRGIAVDLRVSPKAPFSRQPQRHRGESSCQCGSLAHSIEDRQGASSIDTIQGPQERSDLGPVAFLTDHAFASVQSIEQGSD